MRIDISRLNCYCFAIYLFISELTLPFKYLSGSSLMVWVLSAGFFFISLSANFIRFIDMKKFFFMSFFIFFFAVNYFIALDKDIVIDVFFEFLKFVIIPLFMFLLIDNYEEMFYVLNKISMLSLAILLVFVDQVSQRGDTGFINYMEYGNGLAKCFVFIAIPILCYQTSHVKKNICIIMLALILFFIFFYGNRGSFLSVGVFLFSSYIMKRSISTLKRITIWFGLSCFSLILVSYFSDLINFIYRLTTQFNISSYSISKLKIGVDEGISSSVGERGKITEMALDFITSNYGLPRGISYFSEKTGMNYPHNLLLDLTLNFGFLVTISTVLYVFWVFLFMRKSDNTFALSLIFLFSISVLMFSQSFWFYTLFWMFPVYHLFKKNAVDNSLTSLG